MCASAGGVRAEGPLAPVDLPAPPPRPCQSSTLLEGAGAEPAEPQAASQQGAATPPGAGTERFSAAALLSRELTPEAQARCAGTTGDWCGHYIVQEPELRPPPPRYNRTCLWGRSAATQCNFVGAWAGGGALLGGRKGQARLGPEHVAWPAGLGPQLRLGARWHGPLCLPCAGSCAQACATR